MLLAIAKRPEPAATPSPPVGYLLAIEDIPAFTTVTATGAIANSGNAAHRGKIIGVSSEAIANGFVGKLVNEGELTNPSWTWNRGDVLYLNGTALSTTPPTSGFLQKIGVARATTVIVVELGQSVLL